MRRHGFGHEDQFEDESGRRRSGLGGFLHSLLSGIPWSERAEGDETLYLDAPSAAALRVDNANGRTLVVGEDRDDIELKIRKSARAESEAEAAALVQEIRVLHREDAVGGSKRT